MLSDFLTTVSLFNLLDEQERTALAAIMTRKSVTAGETIFEYGSIGREMYIVESGLVELSLKDISGDKILLEMVESTGVFGELSLLDGEPRSATAAAQSDCELLVLDRAALQDYIFKFPHAAIDLLAVFAQRIRTTDQLLMGRVTRNLNQEVEQELTLFQKIANYIAEFSGSIAFLFLNAAFFFIWIIINVGLVPGIAEFDPYPFGFLTMAVSLEAIFLSIFVLLSQNLQSAKDKIRGDIEYEVNLKAELEIAELHQKMDHLSTEVLRELHALHHDRQIRKVGQ